MTHALSPFSAVPDLDLGLVSGGNSGGLSRPELANILAPATEERDRCLAANRGNAWETQACNTRFLESVSAQLKPHLGARIPATSDQVCTRTSSGCFAVGSLVRTPTGMIGIEKLEAGDYVIASTGSAARILRTTRAMGTELVKVLFSDDSVVLATPWHRFYDLRGDLLAAERLPAGTQLRAYSGKLVKVVRVEQIASRPVHNLILERAASFYVNGKPVEAQRAKKSAPSLSLLSL